MTERVSETTLAAAATSPAAQEQVRAHLLEGSLVLTDVADACAPRIVLAAERIAAACRAGGKLLLCGNGGSATDAEHLAAELVNRMSGADRPGIAALALSVNGAVLTSTANDRTFTEVFARQVEALGRPGDVLVALSTSGRSLNVLRALEQARAQGLLTIGLTGAPGGPAAELAEIAIRVPSHDVQHIQEAHIAIGHALCLLVERELYPDLTPPAQ